LSFFPVPFPVLQNPHRTLLGERAEVRRYFNFSCRENHHVASASTRKSGRYPDGASGDAGVSGPLDGWYSLTANTVKIGVSGKCAIAGKVSLYMNGGFRYIPNKLGILLFPDVGLLPFYAQAGVIYHW